METRQHRILAGLAGLALSATGAATAHAQTPPEPTVCTGGDVPKQSVGAGANVTEQPDLIIKGTCTVHAKTPYFYRNVNIIGVPDPLKPGVFTNGKLIFADEAAGNTDFWANTIIVENHGEMIAGSPAVPFGKAGNVTHHPSVRRGPEQRSSRRPENAGPGRGLRHTTADEAHSALRHSRKILGRQRQDVLEGRRRAAGRRVRLFLRL